MNLSELQAELRHFAAERDWQPFHTPKNLTTALMVEAAELAEIFQWMTPDESRLRVHGQQFQQLVVAAGLEQGAVAEGGAREEGVGAALAFT